MRAWQLEKLGGALTLVDRPVPEARPGSVVVRMQSSALMSYMRDYVDGKLPVYHVPSRPFVPGGNGVGIVESVGRDVWHLKRGQRVVISSHFVAQENVRDPAQMLIGVTAGSEAGFRMQDDWPDGTLAEYALLPASTVTPADQVSELDGLTLVTTMRYVVPYGGLLRGRLAAGETIIVSGATGAYGSAAVRLAIAMGAARVVALGRNAQALAQLVASAGPRVVPVAATGDAAKDAAALREAAGGSAQMAFDMVGNARDPNMTLAALRALAFGGRLVLMGSMAVPLPIPYTEVMLNGWEILGQFMYPRTAYAQLLTLIGSGLLSADGIRAVEFPFSDVPNAIDAAATAPSAQCVVINHEV
ncbi:zinc-binding dehydrogenase [Paraburkholderia caledonica]|uniref:zinc-binding dehydrogenase n=1 Tax=Paraburkholderia caledonica TaxID=134536 RepID=UPI000B3F980F|nr:zinc-binding dehydrogenase [Paraburkholderia caledonica]